MMNHRIHTLLRYGTQITQIKRILTVLLFKIIRAHLSYPCHLCAIATVIAALSSCDVDGPLGECPYNARLEYWYVGSGAANVLPDYVHEMHSCIYDSTGTLIALHRTDGSRVVYGELNVPPGKYTIVAWANRDTTSCIYPDAVVGKSKLSDMHLYMNDPYNAVSRASSTAFHQVSEKLYYGYSEIEVTGRGVTRRRVYMTHSHCLLNVTVKWKQYPPLDAGNFSYRLMDVPSVYRFTPGYWLEGDGGSNTYPVPDRRDNLCCVATKATMNLNRSLTGRLVCYRLTNDMHPILGIYSNDTRIVKELDLWKYFHTLGIDLDTNLRQEFDLLIEIDGNEVLVSSVSVGDWEDGGDLGGVVK